MTIKPLPSGSRSLSIDNAYLMLDATVHPDGTVEVHDFEVRDPRSTGLGDTFAKATKAVGIKPCGGCKKRQAALNKLVPYKKSP